MSGGFLSGRSLGVQRAEVAAFAGASCCAIGRVRIGLLKLDEENAPAGINVGNLAANLLSALGYSYHYRPRVASDTCVRVHGLVSPVSDCDRMRPAVQQHHMAQAGQRTAVFDRPAEIVASPPNQYALKLVQQVGKDSCPLFFLPYVTIRSIEDVRRQSS